MNALIIVIALGGDYFMQAERLKRSALQHGWQAEFVVVSDHPDGDVVVPSGGWDDVMEHYTNLERYIPESHDGPVVKLDADTEAIGPEPVWGLHTIAGVNLCRNKVYTQPELQPLTGVWLDGIVLDFKNKEYVNALTAQWRDEWARPDDVGQWGDLLSLRRIAAHIEIHALDGDTKEPYPNSLAHHHTMHA
tara:strand:- start:17372 stop:17944 length:573 start_codon:yes stop_codon:yes gene_type:complete